MSSMHTYSDIVLYKKEQSHVHCASYHASNPYAGLVSALSFPLSLYRVPPFPPSILAVPSAHFPLATLPGRARPLTLEFPTPLRSACRSTCRGAKPHLIC